MKIRLFIILFTIFSFYNSFAQVGALDFRAITTENGLSNNYVSCITQDSQGFIWFGTGYGLNRYDGIDFKIYFHDPKDPESITWNGINSILEDNMGTLWIGTGGRGLNRFDKEQEKFIAYWSDKNDSTSLSDEDGIQVYEDRQGRLWVGTLYGLNLYDRENDQFIRYTHNMNDENSITREPITCMYEDSRNNFWVGTSGGGLELFNRKTGKAVHFRNNPENPNSICSNVVRSIFEDRKSVLWIGTDSGYDSLTFSGDSPIFKHVKTADGMSSQIASKKVFDLYVRKGSDQLINAYQTVDFTDNRGNIWIGTAYEGVKFYNPLRDVFNTYKYRHDDPNGLKNRSVTAICEKSDGNLWIGVINGGLHLYDRKKNSFTYIPLDQKNPNNPYDESALTIKEDSYGDLWIGTWGKGVYRFEKKSGKSIHYIPDENNPESLNCPIRYIFEDSRKNIWLGTSGGGINLYNRKNDSFSQITLSGMSDTFIESFDLSKIVYYIYEDSKENLWFCTGWGLFLFNRDSKTVKNWVHDRNDSTTVSGLHVQLIYEDRKGNLWVGTWYGLNLFNRGNDTFTRFETRDGLPSDNISGIVEDNNGNLWLSTSNGISKFNPINKTFKNYDVNDGLQGQNFNDRAFAKLKTGEFIFGGKDGFTIFHPDSIKDVESIPPVVITDFQIFNKTVNPGDKDSPLKKSISLTDEIILPYYQHSISFEFAVLDYINPKSNKYKYMLEGLHKDWVETTADHRIAAFTNLHPGKYIFRVIGANNKGVWNNKGASINITITPPFWQTLWFRIIIVLLAAGLIYALHSYRLKRQLEIERMRIRIASDLHDDVGASLTKIAVHSEIIQTTSNAQKVKPSAKKIGEVSREIITTMSDIVWSIDARNDTIGNLLDRMHDFVANTLSSRQIKVTFNTKGLESSKKIPVDKRQNIYLIFKEAVNNIAKHAKASQVDIQINNDEQGFRMNIKDNGKGFDVSQKQIGHGLINMKMRAKRINAKLTIHCDQGMIIELTMKSI